MDSVHQGQYFLIFSIGLDVLCFYLQKTKTHTYTSGSILLFTEGLCCPRNSYNTMHCGRTIKMSSLVEMEIKLIPVVSEKSIQFDFKYLR